MDEVEENYVRVAYFMQGECSSRFVASKSSTEKRVWARSPLDRDHLRIDLRSRSHVAQMFFELNLDSKQKSKDPVMLS